MKPLLYLHVGPSKTGTTSFQYAMHILRNKEIPINYPEFFTTQGRGRFGAGNWKQKEIVTMLLDQNEQKLDYYIQNILKLDGPVLLSEEALWYKFPVIDPGFYSNFLAKLNSYFLVNVIFVNRNFDSLIKSNHKQYIKNYEPNQQTMILFGDKHGTLTLDSYLRHPHIEALRDTSKFLEFFQASGAFMNIFPYTAQILPTLFDFLQISKTTYSPLLSNIKNYSPSDEAHALYFAMNNQEISVDQKELLRILVESNYLDEQEHIARLVKSLQLRHLFTLRDQIKCTELSNLPKLGFEVNVDKFMNMKRELYNRFDEFIDFFEEIL